MCTALGSSSGRRKACRTSMSFCSNPMCRSRGDCRSGRISSPKRRSEEHTSELQSQSNLVCRLLLEKKKKSFLSLFLISLLSVTLVILTLTVSTLLNLLLRLLAFLLFRSVERLLLICPFALACALSV